MRMAYRLRAVITAACLMAPAGVFVTSGTAQAAPDSTYIASVASALSTNPVFADKNATPLPQVSQLTTLDNNLRASRRPVYVAFVSNAQANKASSAGELLDSIHRAMGVSSTEVIGVSVTSGFFVRAYNVPQSFAGSVAVYAVNARSQPGRYAQVNAWAKNVVTHWPAARTNTRIGTGNGSHAAASGKHHTSAMTVWTWILSILGVILAIVIIIALIRRHRRNKSIRLNKDRIKRRIESLDGEMLGLDSQMLMLDRSTEEYASASVAYSKANLHKEAAMSALQAGDLEDANMYADKMEASARKVARIIDGSGTPANDTDAAMRYEQTRHASSSDDRVWPPDVNRTGDEPRLIYRTTRNPDTGTQLRNTQSGHTIVINNNVQPAGYATATNPHYWDGGMIGERYFFPGYYPWQLNLYSPIAYDVAFNSVFGTPYGGLGYEYDAGYRDAMRDAERHDPTVAEGPVGGAADWVDNTDPVTEEGPVGDTGDPGTDSTDGWAGNNADGGNDSYQETTGGNWADAGSDTAPATDNSNWADDNSGSFGGDDSNSGSGFDGGSFGGNDDSGGFNTDSFGGGDDSSNNGWADN